MSTTIYNITTPNYKFNATVKRDDEYIEIEFGQSANCSIITLAIDSNIAYLSTFDFDEMCATNIYDLSSLKRNDGTREFFRATLKFIFNNFPNLIGIVFEDQSFISSRLGDGENVSLRDIYLCIHSNTWYGYHFKAKCIFPEFYDEIKKIDKFMGSPVGGENLEDFLKFIENSQMRTKILELVGEHTSKTFRSLFQTMWKIDALYFYDWITPFVKSHIDSEKYSLNKLQWVIYQEFVIPIEPKYTIEISQGQQIYHLNIGKHSYLSKYFNIHYSKEYNKIYSG
jgi:hypothetical protein